MAEAPAGGCASGLGVRVSGFGPVWLSNVVPLWKQFARHDFPALETQLELGRKLHLDLDRRAGVLLGPKLRYEGRDPLPYRKEAVDLGVAGGTECY